jgi:hypothetical protein
MDLPKYRKEVREQERIHSILEMLPREGIESVVDIGARDGHISLLLAERFRRVIALDLATPHVSHPRVECVSGNLTALEFPDASVDAAVCAEVLEHIPTSLLPTACKELERVVRRYVLVGVPYRQDTRIGRTTCRTCKRPNPPWGHVNQFDENRLRSLFRGSSVRSVNFVGSVSGASNRLSALLMDAAGNPYGTYDQDEPCIHCGARLTAPSHMSLVDHAFAKTSFWIRKVQQPFVRSHPNWIHVLFDKSGVRDG